MATIIDAALTVLKTANKPLSADEIYVEICKSQLFEFKSQDPKAILKAQLRKNCLGFTGKSAAETPRLKQLIDKTFQIL
ncbi:HTH domain-containing protein [Polynucleobacter sp.]|uniref:HTH domain-containing protein n=1 Tax=Polynucleobacter sp. TaxID=2029855 RepID=UPI002736CC06|nr:HTH domain-containing protein [Polynucleobacter sp.]MDP3122408.1 HTH domain-containing protein [Polynucleobacter sp.]